MCSKSSCGQLTRGGPPAWELGEGLTCYKTLHRASDLVGSYEHSNEPLDSIKGKEFLD
jgi:hypothetical protein